MARVLAVDDDPDAQESMRHALQGVGHVVTTCGSGAEALAELGRSVPDVLLVDRLMPGMDGFELCKRALAIVPHLPVILVTGLADVDAAIEAIRAGVFDFLVKPITTDQLAHAIHRAARHRWVRDQIEQLGAIQGDAEGLIGRSAAVLEMVDLVKRVAETDASVLICGPSGSGKELVARLLQRHSRRRSGPFVSVNCAAMPESLLESELFGHAKGAFTDAHEARDGLFVRARGGTFFLDEIGDMPLALQPKLLRALQERSVRPVGARHEIPIDVRIVAATNKDLEALVKANRFRADLYFRLDVVRVEVPPLRARGADPLLLARYFLDRSSEKLDGRARTISMAAAERLLAYEWPGNVRELQNCIERAVALGRRDAICLEDLPDRVRNAQPGDAAEEASTLLTLRQLEMEHVARVLKSVSGNKTLAARVLGIDRGTLHRKLGAAHRERKSEP
jgi:DNA-binding NtrC family response regulator